MEMLPDIFAEVALLLMLAIGVGVLGMTIIPSANPGILDFSLQ